MVLETTGCEIASCVAAFAMLPFSATASTICRSRNLMRRPMRSVQSISTLSPQATGTSRNRASRLQPDRASFQFRIEAGTARRREHDPIQSTDHQRRTAMWSRCIARLVTTLAIAACAAGGAAAQDTVKIGMVMPMTGTLAAAGKQVVAGARLYMREHGDMVAGKRVELIVKDDTTSFEVGKRLVQELIVNDKVDVI